MQSLTVDYSASVHSTSQAFLALWQWERQAREAPAVLVKRGTVVCLTECVDSLGLTGNRSHATSAEAGVPESSVGSRGLQHNAPGSEIAGRDNIVSDLICAPTLSSPNLCVRRQNSDIFTLSYTIQRLGKYFKMYMSTGGPFTGYERIFCETYFQKVWSIT